MTIQELKKMVGYSFNLNLKDVTKVKKDIENVELYDEWGVAELFINNKQGVEYNLCIDQSYTKKWIKEVYGEWKLEEMINEGKEIDEEPTNSSAIYLVELNKETGYLETDYDCCEYYEIDFNDSQWKEKLEIAMCETLIEFFKL